MQKHCIIWFIFFAGLLPANRLLCQGSCKPVITITQTKNNICLDSVLIFHSAITNPGTNEVYKWSRNGSYVGTNNASYSASDFRDGDIVTCQYSCTSSCSTSETAESNAITVHVINDIVPIVSVANSDPLICEGETTVFTTTSYYGSAIPSYRWTVNDILISDTLNQYATDTLTNGAKVQCTLTISTPGCPGFSRSSTSTMNIYVYPMVHPAIKITPSRTDICRGEQVSFSATANGGAYPSFSWMVNGQSIGNETQALFTNNLKDGDSVSCVITIDVDSRCHTDTLSSESNIVVIHVKDYPDPNISISAPLLEACAGTDLQFFATTQNTGDYQSYHWTINNKTAGNNAPLFTTTELKNGDSVACSLSTNIPGCSITGYALSNTETAIIHDTPVIQFSPPDISIHSGERAVINASVTGNTESFHWTPANELVSPTLLSTQTLPLYRDTTFNLTATDVNGCVASKDIVVKALFRLHVPSAFTPNRDGKNDVFRIPPAASITLKHFSVFDRWGRMIFNTNDISTGWDGTYNGKDLPPGIYVYVIEGNLLNEVVKAKGTVTLLR